ncbi:MAG: glutathione S-transferase family protein [Myxococcales bacterium]|nr:glutathione S-transferase family protein [Myxococcales bacterium]
MIRLHQFPPPEGLPVSASPYCTKVELYLRLTAREHEVVSAPDPRKSPSKTVPWVTWSDGGVTTDSSAILERLEREGPALDDGLPEAARARGEQLVARVESPIYFSTLFSAFVDQEGWMTHREYVKAGLPWLLRPIVPAFIRRSQVIKCAANGFTSAADYAKGVTAVEEVSAALGDAPFLSGDAPRVVDCCVWAQLVGLVYTHQATPPREALRGDARLADYITRVAARGGYPLPSWS